MLTGIHFILTYTCNFECDHCFLYCSPRSQGTFTIEQVSKVLDQACNIGTVEWIYFEGGEPLLYYPLLMESVRRATRHGFKVGVVTNAYGAISRQDAELWIRPLAESGLAHLSVSNDSFHYGQKRENPAAVAYAVAEALGVDTSQICIETPTVLPPDPMTGDKGRPVVGGGAMFRGRAVDTLTDRLPLRPWEELVQCPYEDLDAPSRVHVDPFGHVHVCQGISIGNLWTAPLSEIIAHYRPDAHPICGPILRGGPAELLRQAGAAPAAGYVDECQLCYLTRRAVIDKHAIYLAPKQVYGL